MANKETIKRRWLGGLLAAFFWIFCWQVLSMLFNMDLILPSPIATLNALAKNIVTFNFWLACLSSMLRVILGFLVGTLLGVVLAILTYFSKIINVLVSPILKIIRAVPVASFIILALVWFKTNTLPAFIATLMVVPMLWNATYEAISSVDVKLLEMAKIFRFSKWQIFKKIYLTHCFSAVLSASFSALGFAWKSAAAAEVISRPKYALGSMLYDSKTYLETADCFAITLMIVVMSLGLEWLIKFFVSKIKISDTERIENDRT